MTAAPEGGNDRGSLLGLELAERVEAARIDRDQALRDLRAAMSDEEIEQEFGLDLSQLD